VTNANLPVFTTGRDSPVLRPLQTVVNRNVVKPESDTVSILSSAVHIRLTQRIPQLQAWLALFHALASGNYFRDVLGLTSDTARLASVCTRTGYAKRTVHAEVNDAGLQDRAALGSTTSPLSAPPASALSSHFLTAALRRIDKRQC